MTELVHMIGTTAMESMLFEVAATPKPGLVDRRNCGAHDDMDYFTFMASAAALHASFADMAALGRERSSEPVSELLRPLRAIGRWRRPPSGSRRRRHRSERFPIPSVLRTRC